VARSDFSRLRSGRRALTWRLLPVVQFWFWIRGKPFVEFYAWMIDRQERNNTIEKILKESERRSKGSAKFKGLYDMSDADSHTRFMVSEGVQPYHTVMDYGCGFGRTAIPLIRYLDADKFVGVEISKERLRIAEDYVRLEGLTAKRPRWIRSVDLDMNFMPPKSVDLIWSIAVVSHQPLDAVKRWLKACHRILNDGGIIIFDYLDSATEEQKSLKDFVVTREHMHDVVRELGYRFEDITADRPNMPREWAVAGMAALKLRKA
jgi:SAM-dependent methyltransferase